MGVSEVQFSFVDLATIDFQGIGLKRRQRNGTKRLIQDLVPNIKHGFL